MPALPWNVDKPLIGVIHLDLLPHQPGCPGFDVVRARALADLRALEDGGVDAVLVENYKDTSPAPFVGPESIAALAVITRDLLERSAIPVGVNVLPNDYRAACALIGTCGAHFFQLDVFSDRVRTAYSVSSAPPFEVEVQAWDVRGWRQKLAPDAPLLASVHPKHYALLEEEPIEESARRAVAEGADVLVVTGSSTGVAPAVDEVVRVKAVAGQVPVFVGSGLCAQNARTLLAVADGAIVGTALKTPDFRQVELGLVRDLVRAVRA